MPLEAEFMPALAHYPLVACVSYAKVGNGKQFHSVAKSVATLKLGAARGLLAHASEL